MKRDTQLLLIPLDKTTDIVTSFTFKYVYKRVEVYASPKKRYKHTINQRQNVLDVWR